MPACEHEGHIDFDSTGRRFCGECGEVLDLTGRIVEEEYESRPEFQIIPSLSSFGSGISYASSQLIDNVCSQCEQTAGIRFSPEMKQKIMGLVEAYKKSIGKRQVYSFENVVRTAVIVVLRNSGSTVPVSKIIPRFDEKKAPVFRLLTRLSRGIDVDLSGMTNEDLIKHTVDTILEHLLSSDKLRTTPQPSAGPNLLVPSLRLQSALQAVDRFSSVPKLSQAIACTFFTIRFGSAFSQSAKRISIRDCIRACDSMDSEKSVYRDYEILRDFMKTGLSFIGIRKVDETEFLDNLDEICHVAIKRNEVTKRLRRMSNH